MKWIFISFKTWENIDNNIDDKYTITLFVHCPVLDLPAPVDDVDVGWSLDGNLGDVDKPLDVHEEGEELSIGDRIE